MQRWSGALGAVALLAVGAACQIEDPMLPTFVVTADAGTDVGDAIPGDGVCSTQPVEGSCTLRAAVEEANAGDGASIFLEGGTSVVLDADLTVAGSVHLRGNGGAVVGDGVDIVAASGATLIIEDLSVTAVGLVSDGNLILKRTSVLGADTGVTVGTGGNGVIQSSWIAGTDVAIENSGVLVLDFTTVGGTDGATTAGSLVTNSGATTNVRSSWLGSPGGMCIGDAPTSLGFNAEAGTSCGLDGPGDIPDGPPADMRNGLPRHASWSPLVDVIPEGTAFCGTLVPLDIDNLPRSQDGDNDGTAACDIGAVETPAIGIH